MKGSSNLEELRLFANRSFEAHSRTYRRAMLDLHARPPALAIRRGRLFQRMMSAFGSNLADIYRQAARHATRPSMVSHVPEAEESR
jgi:hypothetical protein